ncbi:glycosyltransferase [Paraburkholderia hayleyella]|uniref:glycosyltransferase n=1 Tax=Paraburkholderia hayleyella TaxID=2152889 RepID=UPI00129189E9|nr:glycosyltransferase [Paraburkholderia hayleyella]
MHLENQNQILSVSVVVYRPDVLLLTRTLASLASACAALRAKAPDVPGVTMTLYLVDNGGLPDIATSLSVLHDCGVTPVLLSGHGNVGYGRGHNLALGRATSRYHLVLNPDIDLDADALVNAVNFLDQHADAGLLTPCIKDDEGHLQYLCRRYPTVFDLFVRGFLPLRFRRYFAARLARYEMREVINANDVVWDPPIASGCFMMFRTALLKQLNGFDSRYFLYFEDYDLSLRTHESARVVYVPEVRVRHYGGGAARKGWAHIRMFVASAFRFFSRFGWRWF